VHASDKLVASARFPGRRGWGPLLSPNESKTRFGRRGRASVAAKSLRRTCFRMSLTDLADSISFGVVRPAYSRAINFRAYDRAALVSIKFYENGKEKSGERPYSRGTKCIRVGTNQQCNGLRLLSWRIYRCFARYLNLRQRDTRARSSDAWKRAYVHAREFCEFASVSIVDLFATVFR